MLHKKKCFFTTIFTALCISQPLLATTIETITCGQALKNKLVYHILNTTKNSLSGWNHIDVNNDEFSALKLSNSSYQITDKNHKSDHSCDQQNTYQTTLVVKLSDWTRQHANGLEATLDSNTIKFGGVSHLLLDLKIHRNGTYINPLNVLQRRYATLFSEKLNSPMSMNRLDNAKTHLGITLFENGATDQSTASFNAHYILEVDQHAFYDQWLRVAIPITAFSSFIQKEYQNTHSELRHHSNTDIKGIRITAETSQGKQLRNLLGDKWHDSIPESFKEISISLSQIALIKH